MGKRTEAVNWDLITPVPNGDFHAGRLLSHFRKSYGERLLGRGDSARPRLTGLSLIEALKREDYPITSGTYSQIEKGTHTPRNASRFYDLAGNLLDLTPRQKRLLIQTAGLAYLAHGYPGVFNDLLQDPINSRHIAKVVESFNEELHQPTDTDANE